MGTLIKFLFKWKSTIFPAKSFYFYKGTDFQGTMTVYHLENCPSFSHIKTDKKKMASFSKLCWCLPSGIKFLPQSRPGYVCICNTLKLCSRADSVYKSKTRNIWGREAHWSWCVALLYGSVMSLDNSVCAAGAKVTDFFNTESF